ncbi:MAG: hypothetical protein M3N43_01700 [Actinomycetota bacterium]|nr:hypothetical protein [Actinomycetota bacterium]
MKVNDARDPRTGPMRPTPYPRTGAEVDLRPLRSGLAGVDLFAPSVRWRPSPTEVPSERVPVMRQLALAADIHAECVAEIDAIVERVGQPRFPQWTPENCMKPVQLSKTVTVGCTLPADHSAAQRCEVRDLDGRLMEPEEAPEKAAPKPPPKRTPTPRKRTVEKIPVEREAAS